MDSGGSSRLLDSPGHSGGVSGGSDGPRTGGVNSPGSDEPETGGKDSASSGTIDSSTKKAHGTDKPVQEDPCDIHVDAKLQDIERLVFYHETKTIPKKGTSVNLAREGKRIVVIDPNGKSVGTIPASFDSSLGVCMMKGASYAGTVIHSSLGPPIVVEVRIGLVK